MGTISSRGEHFTPELVKLHHRANLGETKGKQQSVQTTLPPADTPYRRLFEASLDGIMIIDLETDQIMDVNPALIDIMGYNRWHFVGKRFPDINPFAGTAIGIAAYEELKNKGCVRQEVCIKKKDGKNISVEFIGNVYLDNTRQMIQCNFRYFRKGASINPIWGEADRRARLLAEIIERSSQPVGIAYQDGSLAIINSAFSELLGYEERELYLLRFPAALTPPEYHDHEVEMLAELRSSKKPVRYEKQYFRRDGTRVPVEVLLDLIEDEDIGCYYYALVTDITSRKQSEEKIKESEERFAQMSQNAHEWIWEVDSEGLYTYASTVVEKILGYRPEEIVGKMHFYDLFVPEERDRLAKEALAQFKNKADFRRLENANLHKDGHVVLLETSGSPILDEQGQLLGYRGLDIDVTERQQAETALRESEERFRQFAENFAHVIWFIHLDHERVLYVSPAFERIWGIATEDLYRHPKLWMESIHPEDRHKVREVYKVIGSPADKITAYDMEYRIVRKDGNIRWIHDYGTKFYGEHGELVRTSGIAEDITERKEAENALRQMKEELDLRVADRTRELAESNVRLQKELTERQKIENALKKRDLEVQARSRKLEEANVALKVLLKRIDEDKKDLQRKLSSNIKHLITPYLEKLRKNHLSSALNETCLDIIETQLNNLFSPFSHKLSSDSLALTPKEIQVADLIRDGKTSKEIADILHISKGVADFHRDHIREKLGIKNRKGNLRTHLLSIR